ncbi:MAG: DUF1934 domain-containing protein [Clostridia bacterium]|nr:DUF1934 domain-containing protein [Clostridia bacterium]MDD4680211.1 DUF1934 domain-containing protein [Clostridia bacterium]
MDRRIMLTIKGSHRSTDGENRSIELITEGRLLEQNGIFHIEYDESEISGKAGTKTRFSIMDNGVSMQRTGTTTSKFLFQRGKKYVDSRATPLGYIKMEVYPTRVRHELGTEEGSLNLKYQLDIDGKSAGTNELNLHYK